MSELMASQRIVSKFEKLFKIYHTYPIMVIVLQPSNWNVLMFGQWLFKHFSPSLIHAESNVTVTHFKDIYRYINRYINKS